MFEKVNGSKCYKEADIFTFTARVALWSHASFTKFMYNRISHFYISVCNQC